MLPGEMWPCHNFDLRVLNFEGDLLFYPDGTVIYMPTLGWFGGSM